MADFYKAIEKLFILEGDYCSDYVGIIEHCKSHGNFLHGWIIRALA